MTNYTGPNDSPCHDCPNARKYVVEVSVKGFGKGRVFIDSTDTLYACEVNDVLTLAGLGIDGLTKRMCWPARGECPAGMQSWAKGDTARQAQRKATGRVR